MDTYAALLIEWQERMNLVARSTLDIVWERHFADSAQLSDLVTESDATWLDLGSGAGFPALVLALFQSGKFHLVEATAKKCRFLSEVVERLDLSNRVTIHNCRIEALPKIRASIITARACASLSQLFDWGMPHARDARWLLLKGKTAADEVEAARAMFTFDCGLIASRTDPQARIVDAQRVRRRQ
ncbi:16S rRNA (guanine(527)-N(7))-methyltransferase RsmG [Glacieibacterium megasporae]|uniref:16S rRNA (guanine(527)-N(7))-methyltransferase RsmG n=1 Tax=Glacieibacterium megasporae TaxID=2835787 RepID=UPI001C1E0CE4|nr:16S rRNA (guanine(527)-N(7))-methyltransferase RsmG [Polymorphobacter megasporae]UAJ10917.1 16S rRNA (guanine(527)-N(7))-methyltransferase RsmG [Polymorphobacter megasporae]